jgi:hypothetical protein
VPLVNLKREPVAQILSTVQSLQLDQRTRFCSKTIRQPNGHAFPQICAPAEFAGETAVNTAWRGARHSFAGQTGRSLVALRIIRCGYWLLLSVSGHTPSKVAPRQFGQEDATWPLLLLHQRQERSVTFLFHPFHGNEMEGGRVDGVALSSRRRRVG